MLEKINKLSIGIILGVVLPAILYFILVMPKISIYSSLDGYYHQLLLKVLPLFLSRCIFPNALLFFFFIWKNLLVVAKGLLVSTAVLTGGLVILNFVL